MEKQELQQIIDFIKETDKFKSTFRATYLSQEENRHEDDAQHSWQLALSVILLKDHFESTLDYTKMLELAITHDLVEMYAGDTFVFDEKAMQNKEEKEKQAAIKLFSKLPKELELKFHKLNDEFTKEESQEAQHVLALDKLLPKIQNSITNYKGWKEKNVSKEKILNTLKYSEFNSKSKELTSIVKEQIEKEYNNN